MPQTIASQWRSGAKSGRESTRKKSEEKEQGGKWERERQGCERERESGRNSLVDLATLGWHLGDLEGAGRVRHSETDRQARERGA